MKTLRLLLAVAVVSGASLAVSWAVRIHDIRQQDRAICQRVENTNTAMRLIVRVRLRDPSTPERVKIVFRDTLSRYLQPVDCTKL